MARFVFGNPDFVYKCSRRKRLGSLEQWAQVNVSSRDMTHLQNGEGVGTRYVALNMENSTTVEFRIFKGTLKPSSFFRALEFCHSVIHFAKDEAQNLAVADFVAFVDNKRDDYPNLFDFLHQDERVAAQRAARQLARQAAAQAARVAAQTAAAAAARIARQAPSDPNAEVFDDETVFEDVGNEIGVLSR